MWLGLGIGIVLFVLLIFWSWRAARAGPPVCQYELGFKRVSRWVASTRDGSIEVEFGRSFREGHIVYSNRAKPREACISYEMGRGGMNIHLRGFEPIKAEPMSEAERAAIGEHIRAAAWALRIPVSIND